LLGDRKGIEEKTTTWDEVIVDRQGDLSEWVSEYAFTRQGLQAVFQLADRGEELAQRNEKSVITIHRRVYICECNSLRVADTAHQVLKARVRAEIVDPQVSFEVPRDIQGSLLVSSF